MAKYKLSKDVVTGEELPFILLGEDISIPKDIDNTDYQTYLAWVAEGNTPDPAD
tara:strand:+ start:411 stop:572 length:162 start_codon:yes stop_codon:yes gene_type:complete